MDGGNCPVLGLGVSGGGGGGARLHWAWVWGPRVPYALALTHPSFFLC